MTSSRVILALLGIIFLFIVILSSSRILDTLRRRVGLVPKQEVKEIQITITPGQENSKDEGKEIPQTGPAAIVYLLLGGGLLSGIAIKRFKPYS